MFTGIIKELGNVSRLEKSGDRYRLAVKSSDIYKNVSIGDSLSINGVCLTVAHKEGLVLYFDVMEETIKRTNLKLLKDKDRVNLEDSLRAGDHLGGHFVLGHVDCVGRIRDIKKRSDNVYIDIEIPGNFSHLVVEKGSVAVDGVSLTIGEVGYDHFRVYLIPHTLMATNLNLKNVGDELNLEFDIIGKYIARFKDARIPSNITEDFLRNKGF